MPAGRAIYTVHLRVKVEGPEAEWDEVADKLVKAVASKPNLGLYTVVAAELDSAEPEG